MGDLIRFKECGRHECAVTALAFHPEGSHLLSAAGVRIRRWSVASSSSEDLCDRGPGDNAILTLAYAPDGRAFASAGKDSQIQLFPEEVLLAGHDGGVNALSFHPQKPIVASGGDDRTVKLWSCEEQTCLLTLHGHRDRVRAVSFSPNGNLIASGGAENDKIVKLWNLRANEAIDLVGHSDWFGGVNDISFSANSKAIASGSKDKTIEIWNASTGKEVKTLEGHADEVLACQIAPNGTFLASCGNDKTLKIWELPSGNLIRSMPHEAPVLALTVAPDSRNVAIGCEDGAMWMYDLDRTARPRPSDLF